MPDNIKSLSSLFPLIDDPANIFYSNLKSLYFSFIRGKAELKRISRTRYSITVSYPNITEPLVRLIDIRDIKKEEETFTVLPGQTLYLYAKIRVAKVNVTNEELTTSGESIPVKEYYLSCSSDNKYYFMEYSLLLFTGTPERILIDNNNSHIYYLVCPVQNLYNNTMTPEEEDYTSLYKPEIGRHWELFKNGEDTEWRLYSIDSDFNEILIDDSSVTFTQNKLPSVQIGPYVDHRVSLCFKKIAKANNAYDLYVYEKEYLEEKRYIEVKYSRSTDYQNYANMKLYYRAEEVLYSAHSYNNLEYLISSIKFRETPGKVWGTDLLKRELVFLALSYVMGINIRFFFKSFGSYDDDTYDTYNYSPTKIKYSDFDSSLPVIVGSVQTAFPSFTSWNYYSDNDHNYVSVPIMQNTLGFSTRSIYDRYIYYNNTFIDKVYNGFGMAEDHPHPNETKPFKRSSLSFRSKRGTDLFSQDAGFKTMQEYIEELPYLYEDIGGGFLVSLFNF